MQLQAKLPDVFRSKSNVNDMESKTEIIQIILDSLRHAGHGNQSMNKLRKKYLLPGVSGEYKDLQKFIPDSYSHLFGRSQRIPLKRQKVDITVCKHSSIVQKVLRHIKGKLMLTCYLQVKKLQASQKPWTGQKDSRHKQGDNIQSKTRFSYQERSHRSQELREHIDLQISQIVSHNRFFLHEEVKNFQAGNISKHIKAGEKSQQIGISWIQ